MFCLDGIKNLDITRKQVRMGNKIALLSISLIKGGAENQLVKLAVDLKKRGNSVSIIALLPDNDFIEILKENNIPYNLILLKNILSLKKVVAHFKVLKPDVIISFMFGANIIGRLVRFFTGIPLITSVRNNMIDKKFYFLYKLTHQIDTITTFNSSFSLNKFVEKKLTNPSKSYLVNNSIEVPDESVISDKNNFADCFTITSMAHFRPQKDYRTLIEAIKIVKERGKKVKVFILGHLYNNKWPFELLKKYELESFIEIVGFKKSPRPYLNKSNAVVLSSLWEGTPNALLEGMANKLPVISSEIPGCKELLEDSKGGLLFEMQNAEDLADKIIQLMEMSDDERKEISENGYKHVAENYASKIVYDKWSEMINKALLKRYNRI